MTKRTILRTLRQQRHPASRPASHAADDQLALFSDPAEAPAYMPPPVGPEEPAATSEGSVTHDSVRPIGEASPAHNGSAPTADSSSVNLDVQHERDARLSLGSPQQPVGEKIDGRDQHSDPMNNASSTSVPVPEIKPQALTKKVSGAEAERQRRHRKTESGLVRVEAWISRGSYELLKAAAGQAKMRIGDLAARAISARYKL